MHERTRRLLRHAPLPTPVAEALLDRGGDTAVSVAGNPYLDRELWRAVYTPDVDQEVAEALLWSRAADVGCYAHAARFERRPRPLRVLADVAPARVLAGVQDWSGLSPAAAQALLNRVRPRRAVDRAAGQLSLPDAAVWLLNRWADVDVDVAVEVMASARGRHGRRSWLPAELAGCVLERPELVDVLLATGHPTLIGQAAVAARPGDCLTVWRRADQVLADSHRHDVVQRLLARLDLPADVRTVVAADADPQRPVGTVWDGVVLDVATGPLDADQAAWVTSYADRTADESGGQAYIAATWQVLALARNRQASPDARTEAGQWLAANLTSRAAGGLSAPIKRALKPGRDVLVRRGVIEAGQRWQLRGSGRRSDDVADRLGPRPDAQSPWSLDRRAAQVADLDAGTLLTSAVDAAGFGRLLAVELGTDLHAWDTALELLVSWGGTPAELAAATRAMVAG